MVELLRKKSRLLSRTSLCICDTSRLSMIATTIYMLIANMVMIAGVPVTTVQSSMSYVIAHKCKHLYLLVHVSTHAFMRRSANACTLVDEKERRKHKSYVRHSTGEQVAIATHQRSWAGVCKRALPASGGYGGVEFVVHCPPSYKHRPPSYRQPSSGQRCLSIYVCRCPMSRKHLVSRL